MNPVAMTAIGTGFAFLMTVIGSAVVFFFRGGIKESFQRVFLGFAAGVMTAAAVWSLLTPAIEEAAETGIPGWLPAGGGFLLGALFLFGMDKLLPHLHPDGAAAEGIPSRMKRSTLLFFAVTLHNIPVGMAVGFTFSLASQSQGGGFATYASALALAAGIGLQNLPEGAALSLPLRKNGFSARKAFLFGSMSGAVEPVFGLLTIFAADSIRPAMPWLLSFAAGSMIYVVVEELIPEAHLGEHSHAGTFGVIFGFLAMMILDVALG